MITRYRVSDRAPRRRVQVSAVLPEVTTIGEPHALADLDVHLYPDGGLIVALTVVGENGETVDQYFRHFTPADLKIPAYRLRANREEED
jgi:hypothetical protein